MPGTAFVRKFIDPILPPVPKTEKKAVERLILASCLTVPFSFVTVLLSVLRGEGLPWLQMLFFCATVWSLTLFLKGRMKLVYLQWVSVCLFALQIFVENLEAQSTFHISALEAFSLTSSAQYGPTAAIIIYGLVGPGYFQLFYCWVALFFCMAVSPKGLKETELFRNLLSSFALQTWLGVFYNATEKVSELELELALKHANESGAMKTKFISWLSHDLRTPLVGLNGFLEQLFETGLTAIQQDYLSNALSCAQSVSGLITHLLDFSLIETRQITLQNEIFNLPNTLQFLNSLMAKMAAKKGIGFDFTIDSKLLPYSFVQGDWLRLQQVVTNLTVNAIKYTPSDPSNKVSVKFELGSFSEKERILGLRIVVEDTGIGIPASELPHIFQPFYQIKNPFSAGGAGLGLFIVSEIISAMKGKISCRSAAGVGSTFVVEDLRFPLPPSDTVTLELHKKANSSWNIERAQQVHILLAEDNKLNQVIFRKLLKSCNFQCTIVSNGQEVVDEWKTNAHKYSLILMDLQMPVKDGLEATREIRELEHKMKRRNSIPIVALTATTFPAELEKAIASGMNECLTKPVQKHVLEECVFRVLSTVKWSGEQVHMLPTTQL